ncbi:MAG: ATP-binding protein [Candidatus Pacebacteria bacterium]|nr:ATP-binding protein [Candidatus Paceibacterota bacterium]
MQISRHIEPHIHQYLFEGKIVAIFGARQVGKTTLMRCIMDRYTDKRITWLNCDEMDARALLQGASSTKLKRAFGGSDMVFIDEAQRVPDIGITLKIAIDTMPEVQFVVSGSSSFDLANKINEPLTGRKYEFMLYPLSWAEIAGSVSERERARLLPEWLRFGTYPDVVTHPERAEEILRGLVQSTMYRDILEHQTLRHAPLLERLLQALALQVGNEVSYGELADTLGTNKTTVERYVGLLEQSFIIFHLPPFSRNLRNELKRLRKVYFYDVGIRNALIRAHAPLDLRADVGALWENVMIMERMKNLGNSMHYVNPYFWRTHEQQEIDYLEEADLHLSAFEFKWSEKRKCGAPKAFREGYPDASFTCITPETYAPFVGIPNK